MKRCAECATPPACDYYEICLEGRIKEPTTTRKEIPSHQPTSPPKPLRRGKEPDPEPDRDAEYGRRGKRRKGR